MSTVKNRRKLQVCQLFCLFVCKGKFDNLKHNDMIFVTSKNIGPLRKGANWSFEYTVEIFTGCCIHSNKLSELVQYPVLCNDGAGRPGGIG